MRQYLEEALPRKEHFCKDSLEVRTTCVLEAVQETNSKPTPHAV